MSNDAKSNRRSTPLQRFFTLALIVGTSDLAKRLEAAQAELQTASLSLAWACRDSLNTNLDAGLPALKYRQQPAEDGEN